MPISRAVRPQRDFVIPTNNSGRGNGLKEGNGVSVYYDLQPPNSWPEHQHPTAQIVIALESVDAVMRWSHGGHQFYETCTKPHVWIVPPGMPHSAEWKGTAAMLVLYVECDYIREECGCELAHGAVLSLPLPRRDAVCATVSFRSRLPPRIVASAMKSQVQTWFLCVAFVGSPVEWPRRRIFRLVGGTRRPSSRRSRRTWRLPTCQPSCCSRAAIRRYQQAFANGFGLQANYTHMDASGQNGPLPFSSKNQINIGPYYENRHGLLRLTYTWRDDFATGSFNGSTTVFTRPNTELDANAQINLTKNVSLLLTARNLTDETYQQYFTVPNGGKLFADAYKVGRTFSAAVHLNF